MADSNEEKKWDVFVSYASEDRETIARPLVHRLRRSGLSVWYDQIDSHVDPTTDAKRVELEELLRTVAAHSLVSIVAITPNYLNKSWTRMELLQLVAGLFTNTRGRLVLPVLSGIAPSDLEDQLGPLLLEAISEQHELLLWDQDEEKVPDLIVDRLAPRSLMTMHKFNGPGQLVVFEETGIIVVGHDGGLFDEAGSLDIIDFTGRKLAGGTLGKVMESFFSGVEGEWKLSSELIREFDGYFCYGHVCHLRQTKFESDDARDGSIMNFGTNDRPLVFYPLFVLDAITGGRISHELDEKYQELLEIAKGSYAGNWRRIVVGDGRFHVLGDR